MNNYTRPELEISDYYISKLNLTGINVVFAMYTI